MKKILLTAISSILVSSYAYAAPSQCLQGEKVLFSCLTGKKVVSFCARGQQVQYRFGPLGQPEIVIPKDRSIKAFTYNHFSKPADDGVEGFDITELSVKSGAYEYTATTGYANNGNRSIAELVVSKRGTSIATLKCNPYAGVDDLDWGVLSDLGIKSN